MIEEKLYPIESEEEAVKHFKKTYQIRLMN